MKEKTCLELNCKFMGGTFMFCIDLKPLKAILALACLFLIISI